MKTSLILTLAITWAIAIPFAYLQGKALSPSLKMLIAASSCLALWIPGAIGLLFAKKEGIQIPLLKNPKWYFLGLAFISSGCLLWYILPSMLPSGLVVFEFPILIAFAFGVIGIFNSLLMMGQEIYWRGYLHEKLRREGILRASLLIGPFWGLQQGVPHLFCGKSWMGFLLIFLFNVSITPLLFWFREKIGSIWAVSFLVVLINLGLFAASLALKEWNQFLLGTTGLVWILAFTALSSWIIYRERAAHAR